MNRNVPVNLGPMAPTTANTAAALGMTLSGNASTTVTAVGAPFASTGFAAPSQHAQLMTLDPQTAAASHEALVKVLLNKPQSITPAKLWSFLQKIKLSRDVTVLENLRDGMIVAEIIHTYAPLLVTVSDLQRLDWENKCDPSIRRVWNHLGLTAFKQLCIQITEEMVAAFEADDHDAVSTFLIALFQQLDQYDRILKSFNSYTRTTIADHYLQLSKQRTFAGTPLRCEPTRPWHQGKTVIRLSNVDYQTSKADVQRFLYPIMVEQHDIHVPVHLSSGKMMYTIYIVFDDAVLPLRAVDLHSGHTLLTRRVEIKVVPIDELLSVLFGRGIQVPHFEELEWVTEETKNRLLKLCTTVKNCFNGKTPERPFEHALSFIQLLPWTQNCPLTAVEMARLFELVDGTSFSLYTFLRSEGLRGRFTPELLERFVTAALALSFNDEQRKIIQSTYLALMNGPHELVRPLPSSSGRMPGTASPFLFTATPSQSPAGSMDQASPGAAHFAMPPRGGGPGADHAAQDLWARRIKSAGGPPAPLSIQIPAARTAHLLGTGPLSAPLAMSAPSSSAAYYSARTSSPLDVGALAYTPPLSAAAATTYFPTSAAAAAALKHVGRDSAADMSAGPAAPGTPIRQLRERALARPRPLSMSAVEHGGVPVVVPGALDVAPEHVLGRGLWEAL
ncbi:hypothetical protein GGF32_001966 [Allomyces javanicus]|nr:hypothetical protein GGF32_001966 [Allomyces javanicus]